MTRTTVGLVWLSVIGLVLPASAAETGEGPDLSWFGILRMRPEYSENMSDLSAGRDDKIGYAAYRANLGARIGLPRDVGILFEGHAVGLWGEDQSPFRGSATQDGTSADISFFQAYAEARNIFDSKFGIRAGRQTLVFGDEWLMGDADFYSGTSFDGIRGDFDAEHGQTSVFWAKIAETNSPEGVATTEDEGGDSDLYGIWSAWDLAKEHHLDVGVIYVLDHRILPSSTFPFQDKRWTGTVSYDYGGDLGLFARANVALQWGTTLAAGGATVVDISGDAAEITGGYVWELNEGTYKLYGRVARYSGDSPGTEDSEIFMPLFQDQHARYGYLDFWSGLWGFAPYIGGSPGFIAMHVGFDARLPSGLRVGGYIQRLKRDERISPSESNRELGEEFGVLAGYDYGENVSLEFAFAQVYPGTSIELEPPYFGSTVARRIYLNSVVRF